jgi:hypothetical protein
MGVPLFFIHQTLGIWDMVNLPIFEQYFMVKPNSLAFVQSPMLRLLTNCAKYTTNDHPMAPLSLAQGIFTGDR